MENEHEADEVVRESISGPGGVDTPPTVDECVMARQLVGDLGLHPFPRQVLGGQITARLPSSMTTPGMVRPRDRQAPDVLN